MNAPELKVLMRTLRIGAVIDRKDLQQLTDHVISVIGRQYSHAARERLRHVAATTEQVAYGDWQIVGTECLALQAGIARCESEPIAIQFDAVMRDLLRDLHHDTEPQIVIIAASAAA